MCTKSILLLGGSTQQVVAIETAKRLGYRTVLCDYLPDNPGQHVADVFYQESTTDVDRMLDIARREQVDGVLAYASDPAALTAAYVCEKLGLPTNPYESVRVLSVKHLFRGFLAEHGFNCPRCVEVREGDSASSLLVSISGLRFPIVIKPTDSSGSKGVSVVDCCDVESLESAIESARSFSRNSVVIAEEYITSSFPRVIGGDIFVVGGEVRFWGLMSCLRDHDLGGLVPVGERCPSGLSPEQDERVRKEISDLVRALGLSCGEFNVEVIVSENDEPYFLELGARAGGNMIPVQLSDISGIDLVEANVRYAMGDHSLDVTFSGSSAAYATYVLHADRAGTFEDVEISRELSEHVYRRVMYVREQERVESFDGANKAIGILFLSFDSSGQMESFLDDMAGHARVVIS